MNDVDILLAEDNPADADLIIHCLGSSAISDKIHHVFDGADALDFIFCRGEYNGRSFDSPPRLVLLDLKMPRRDGFEVLNEIKRDPRTAAIPVVLLTSSKVERDLVRGYALGANSYVQKPVGFPALREVVERIGRYWLTTNEPAPRSAFREDTA